MSCTEQAHPPFTPLVAQILEAQVATTHAVTTGLIDTLMRQVADATARRAAVEGEIAALLNGRYMPTPRAILDALYPDDETIARYADHA
jgi:hypothetical protein